MIKAKIKLNMIDDVKEFMKQVLQVHCDVDLQKGRYLIDAKSLIAIFTLSWDEPVDLIIHSDNKELLVPFAKWIVQ